MRPSLYEQLALDQDRAHQAVLQKERRERELVRMRHELAGLELDLAVLKLRRALRLKYRPDQPRVPAGNSDGGQWTSEGGSIRQKPGSSTGAQRTRLAAEITGFKKHGINQAINRGVKPAAILDAVTNPLEVRPRSDGSTQYRGRDAVVVLDPGGVVITVWPK